MYFKPSRFYNVLFIIEIDFRVYLTSIRNIMYKYEHKSLGVRY